MKKKVITCVIILFGKWQSIFYKYNKFGKRMPELSLDYLPERVRP